ncbi:MAG TPA: CPCC family cysteine-rich protein, partial [Bryobacteraceae bacterium]|nr:CPCC family cysteine-rich protein [Bryobacteraceae bacterium]
AGGANQVCLSAARLNYLRYGACEQEFVGHVRPPRLDEFPPTRVLDGLEKPEYLREQKIQILALARCIRHGIIGIAEGSREIAALTSNLGQPELETALVMFVGIASDLDDVLIIGKPRDLWNQQALAVLDGQVAEYESRVKGRVFMACQTVETLVKNDLLAAG